MGSKVRHTSQEICSRTLSCHRPFCRAHYARSHNMPSRSPTSLPAMHVAPLPVLFLPVPVAGLFLRSSPQERCSVCRIFHFRNVTLSPIRASILHDASVPVVISGLVIKIQDVVVGCDCVSKRWAVRSHWRVSEVCFCILCAWSWSSSKHHNSAPSRKCVNALRSPFGFASLALSVPTAVVFLTLPRASLPVSVTTEGGVASARGSPRASVSAEGHFHISAASSSIIRSEKGSSSL